MNKTIGFNKSEIKEKFDKFYEDGKSHWSFDTNDKMYVVKKDTVEPFLDKAKTILDLGCAEGNFLASIINSKNGQIKVGVDISETAILLAKEKNFYDELYINYIDEIENYTKNIKHYDLILLNEVLYYVDDYKESLEKILRLSPKYVFVSLAMGPQFFSSLDANIIEKTFQNKGYRLSKKIIFDMNHKFGVPIRFWSKLLEILKGYKLKQTHKYIYIYEKINNN